MVYSNLYARLHSARQAAGAALRAVWNLRPARWYFLIVAVLQLAAWLQAVYIYRHLAGDSLVRHYNVDFGIDLIGDPSEIFIYPSYGLAVFIINLGLAALGRERQDFRVFTHLLLAAAVVFALFLNVALFFIYLINFR
jgi:hypothetical protein